MNEYRYISARADGTIKKGREKAMSIEELRTILESRELYLLKYDVIDRSTAKLNLLQLAEFCRELSSLLGAGVPIGRSLDIICRRTTSTRTRNVYSSVIDHINRGEPLHVAMEDQNGAFPSLLIKMVKAGESGGKLDDSLLRMAVYYEAEYRTQKELRGAMIYPAVLLVITLVVIVAVFTFVFPSFSKLFEGMELPALTQFMMSLSRLFTEQPFVLLSGILLVTLVFIWLKELQPVRSIADRMKLRLPYVGRLNRIIYTARFARIFSSLYSGGMPVLGVLYAAQETIGNSYIASQFDDVIHCVSSGGSMSKALSAVDGLDIKLTAALAVGEESGRTEELLVKMAGTMEYEASAATKKLVRLAEPLLILLMAAVILLVVLSVMIPIYDMYGSIGSQWGI